MGKNKSNLSTEAKEWIKKISSNGSEAFETIPKELFTEEFCNALIKKEGWALGYIPDALRTEAVCLNAIQQNGLMLEYVPEALKTESLCLMAVESSGCLEYVPEVLKTETMCVAAYARKKYAEEYFPESIKTLFSDEKKLKDALYAHRKMKYIERHLQVKGREPTVEETAEYFRMYFKE